MPSPHTDRDPQGLPALPAELEDRFYEIVLENEGDERRTLLDALVARHSEWSEALLERAAAMTEGDRVLVHARDPLGKTPIPEQVDKYRILDLLGEGGFGAVYRAEQHEPVHRIVALKVLHPRRLDARSQFRFQAEGQTLARMQHASIAQIYDAGSTTEGVLFFAMELVDGKPITDWCDSQQLALGERIDLFLRVCSGVQHAHQRGVVHRDLKPGNVLVKTEGNHPVPKIIDFGVAKVLQEGDSDATVTRDGALIGTPGYMSPEQASGESIDTRTDVYALGVLLYEMLTGDLPFSRRRLLSTSASAAAKIVREEEPRRLITAFREVSDDTAQVAKKRGLSTAMLQRELGGDLEWIVRRALAKNPDHRYASVSDLIADVKRYERKEPVAAREHAALYLARRFVARHRVGVAVSLAYMVATLVVIIALAWSLDQVKISQQTAIERGNTAVLNEYAAHVAAARAALTIGDSKNAREHLHAAAMQHRGWEWYYLMSQCDTSLAAIDTENGAAIGWLSEHRVCLIHSDGNIQIWDTESQTLEDTPLVLESIGRCYWSQSRGRLFAITDNHSRIIAVDTREWEHVVLFEVDAGRAREAHVRSLALSPDERTIAMSNNSGEVTLLDASAALAPRQLCVAPSHTVAMSFTPDGNSLILGLISGSIQIRSVRDGALLAEHAIPGIGIRAIALDASGATVFVAMGRRLLRVDLGSGRVLEHMDPGFEITKLVRSEGERALYGIGGPGSGQMAKWSTDTLEWLGRFHGHRELMRGLDLHLETGRIASITTESARIWNGSPRPRVVRLEAGFNTNDLGISADGEAFAVVSPRGTVKMWNARTCAKELEMDVETPLYGCALTGDTVFVGGDTLLAIDRVSQSVREGEFPGQRISRMCIDPKERWLAAASAPWGLVWIWRLPDLAILHEIELPNAWDRMAFDETRDSFVIGADDETLRWIDPLTGEVTPEHHPGIGSYALSIHKGAVATGDDRLFVRLPDGDRLAPLGTATKVASVAFSPNLERLLTGTNDSLVTLWDRNGTELLVLDDAPRRITELAFVAGGERIIGLCHQLSADSYVMVWGAGLR